MILGLFMYYNFSKSDPYYHGDFTLDQKGLGFVLEFERGYLFSSQAVAIASGFITTSISYVVLIILEIPQLEKAEPSKSPASR